MCKPLDPMEIHIPPKNDIYALSCCYFTASLVCLIMTNTVNIAFPEHEGAHYRTEKTVICSK